MELAFSPLRTVDLVAVSLRSPGTGLPTTVRVLDADVAYVLGQIAAESDASAYKTEGHPAGRHPGLDALVEQAEERIARERDDRG